MALGVVALAAVGAAVLVTLSNRHHKTSRDAVAAYIRQVNAVQDSLRYQLTRVEIAYRAFGSGQQLGSPEARQLTAAQHTLSKVQRRVLQLRPPSEARRLGRLVVRLIGDEAGVTHEVALFAAFVPGFKAALLRVHLASIRLGSSLAAIRPPTSHSLTGTRKQVVAARRAFSVAATHAALAQASVVSAYDLQLRIALRQLARLEPPPAVVPAYRAQEFTLRTTTVAGDKLAEALRSTNRSDVPALGRAFTIASRQSQAISAQRAEASAVRAYDGRVRALGGDANAVRNEVARLQRVLP